MDVKMDDLLAGDQSAPPVSAPAEAVELHPAATHLLTVPDVNTQTAAPGPADAAVTSAGTSDPPATNGHRTQSPQHSPDPAIDIPVLTTPAPLDPALDEDAPHEEDDDGSDNGSPFMSLTHNMPRDTLRESSVDSSQPALGPSRASLTPARETRSGGSRPPAAAEEADQKPVNPAVARIVGPKRRRISSERVGTPRKTPSRVKPPEQLAAEALIEQQNPNATKNELRSLKLRALHAGRIQERERNMSVEEKTRRQRLREYVRQKRAEERIQKSQAMSNRSNPAEAGDQSLSFSMDVDTSFNSTTTGADCRMFELPQSTSAGEPSGGADANKSGEENNGKPPTDLAPTTTELPSGREVRPRTKSQPTPAIIPEWRDPKLQTATAATNASPVVAVTSKAPKPKRRRASTGNNGDPKTPRRKSSSRVKTPEQASLEALIEKQNPNASKTQLKSLKLRALHAGRIAEREQNMSEKEKARRQKLREYMRRRRDEERNQPPGTMPAVLCGSAAAGISSTHASSSNMNQELQPDPSGRSMSGLGGQGSVSVSTELNAADRLAAFSIMELNNNFQHQFGQTHEPMGVAPQSNMHLHPLFQMPMAQSSVQVGAQYDCTMHAAYGIADGWGAMEGQQHQIGGMSAEEAAQKALHAALEEAMYMKHPEQLEGAEQQRPVEAERLAQLEEERIRIAEEEILGVARMADAEMALIAAAAAEVERAHHMGGGSTSAAGGGM